MTGGKTSKRRGPHKQNPKSKANLVSLAKRPPKERKKIASKGGRISAKKYKDELKLQRIAQMLLQSKLPEGELKNRLIDAGISAENATHGAGMLMKLTDKVLENGDVRAFEAIRDTAGEKPTVDITSGGEPITGIDIAFVKFDAEKKDGRSES